MNISTSELQARFADARKEVPVGSVWKHKKGGMYMVTGHGFDTEHGRINVHYYRIGGPNFDEQAETGISFDRPIFLWTQDRFQEVSPFSGEVKISRSKLSSHLRGKYVSSGELSRGLAELEDQVGKSEDDGDSGNSAG